MTNAELDKLVMRLKSIDPFSEYEVNPDGPAAADAIAALREANGILEDALQEVGDDYPGSSCQEWCQQQVKAARAALTAYRAASSRVEVRFYCSYCDGFSALLICPKCEHKCSPFRADETKENKR